MLILLQSNTGKISTCTCRPTFRFSQLTTATVVRYGTEAPSKTIHCSVQLSEKRKIGGTEIEMTTELASLGHFAPPTHPTTRTDWINELKLLAISHPKRTKWINELTLLAILHHHPPNYTFNCLCICHKYNTLCLTSLTVRT